MKLYSLILGALLLGCAAAGGIRGAYERMFIWYAYQAEIEHLGANGLDGLTICRDGFGDGPHDTLTFNQFIEYTNRAAAATTAGTIYDIVTATQLRPNVDNTARNMYNNRYITARWNAPSRMITGVNSYTAMLERVGARLYELSNNLGATNANIANAIDAVQKVALSREIDYESYRMPAMEAAPEFSGENKVNFVTWDVQLRGDGDAKSLDLPSTEAAHPGITQRVTDWQNNVYHADQTPDPQAPRDPRDPQRVITRGETRANHWGAFQNAKRAESISTTGAACA